jgi:molybdopterin-containing oxidoreductase family iron-sulfur binding subunit
MKYALVIDLLKCMGCNACTVACRAERGTPAEISYTRVRLTEAGKYPDARMRYLPISCMQCQEPRCVEACPNEATYKRDDGIVLIDANKCVGCGACVVACPYGSRQILKKMASYYPDNHPTPYEAFKQKRLAKGVAVKCDFCLHRLEKNRLPACVETCPGLARIFGDLDDPNSEVRQIIARFGGRRLQEELGTEPSIIYIRM